MGIDTAKQFQPVSIAVLTVSDTRTPDNDKSGNLLAERIAKAGHHLAERGIVTDDIAAIAKHFGDWSQLGHIDAIITTGGTGLTGRDVTPEALKQIMDKPIEGFGEAFRWMSYQKIGTSAMQSRAMGCVVNGVYVFALLPVHHQPVAMAGTNCCRFSLILDTSPAILWKSCHV